MTDRRPVLARTVALLGATGCGKTALVGAWTGRDELHGEAEHRTGRTLAPHASVLPAAPGARTLTVLDLPGPGAVDPVVPAALLACGAHVLCVALDEGVTEGTRAYAALLAGLGLTAGVLALTRADRGGDADTVLTAARGLAGVAEDPGVLVTSAREGADPAALVDVLGGGPRRTHALDAAASPVLHVEDAREVPGAGVVVEGGLLRGTLRAGEAVALLPAWSEATVGALRVREELTGEAVAGERVTVRLDGIAPGQAQTGMALVRGDGDDAGSGLRRTQVLDVALHGSLRPEHGSTVLVHAAARVTRAEVGVLGGRFHQLRTEDELLVAAWDRVLLRDAAPPHAVLGGGDVLDPGARRHGPSRDVLAELTGRHRERPES